MVKSLGRQALTAATVVTFAGAGAGASAGAVQAHARPADFSAGYTCRVPALGTRSVTIDGTLTASPSRTTTHRPTRFRLHISGLSLRSPVPIDSWKAAARIEVTGGRASSFLVTGSGGLVPAHRPITADLTGVWTPRARGVHRLRIGDIAIRATSSRLGSATATCVPAEPRPVAATLPVT